MIMKFIRRRSERRAERQRSYRALLAGTLARKIDESDELTLDRTLQAELGAPHRELLHTAYELALQERIHIMAENDGVVRLMSNHRFEQMTREYASTYTTAGIGGILLSESEEQWSDSSIEPLSVTDPDSEAIFLDEAAFLEPITEQSAMETLKSGKERRDAPPDGRKTLPPREREPWFGFDEITFPRINADKKSK